MAKFDYLIVGSGWFGAVFAREMTNAGYKCLVIERRTHIGGNCFTKDISGINVHVYGPHIFHTNSPRIWRYVNQFARFEPFIYRGCASFEGRRYSFPINLDTMRQVWGVASQAEAQERLSRERLNIDSPANLEEFALSEMGERLYRMFIHGYTTKQWRRAPALLPASILKRIPIRTTADDRYFDDLYQGIPAGGYTPIFHKLLEGSVVELGVDYFRDRKRWHNAANRIVYTGMIDQFYDYRFGSLEYRTLRFESRQLASQDYQGTAVVNFTDREVPYTRVIEHKFFSSKPATDTVVTWEYPENWTPTSEPYYPINDARNQDLYNKYCELGTNSGEAIIGGRLGSYRYYDMHQVIGAALRQAEHELLSRRHV